MRRYETIFILRSSLGEDQFTEFTEKVGAIIAGDGGTVIAVDKWGLKKLAYLIDKENQGYYIYLDYSGQPTTVTEIERISKIDDRVLKYMTVKLADSCDPAAVIEEMAKQREQAAAEAESAETATEDESEEEDED